jgi:hypothetical protein
MSALFTALVEGESKASLAGMVCELREALQQARADLWDEKHAYVSAEEFAEDVTYIDEALGSIPCASGTVQAPAHVNALPPARSAH